MKRIIYPLIILFSTMFISCTQYGNNAENGLQVGALSGAIIGQAIGHDTQATLVGAAVGSMFGYMVGNEMDKADRNKLNSVYERTQSQQTVKWQNPDTGNSFAVTPQPAYRTSSSNQVCRRAEIVARIGGELKKTYSTACRNHKGE